MKPDKHQYINVDTILILMKKSGRVKIMMKNMIFII